MKTSVDTASLTWNVKSSFRAYVLASGGTIDVLEPATRGEEGFHFPASKDNGAGPDVPIRFTGSVRFSAHGGAMNLLVSEPWIHTDGLGTRLSIAGSESTRTAGGRLFIAQLEPCPPLRSPGQLSWTHVPTQLLAEGAAAFDFNYPAGTELAEVSYSIVCPENR